VRLDGDLFYRPGVSAAVLTDLKKGRLRPTATIDLHGSSANEAAVRLQRFIDSRANVAPQCLLVITGRGSHSPGGHSVIREQTLEQLRRHFTVQAYACSRPADGGSGAFYVLVRSGRLD
jgi:DNA-nicking Smr family endonuclease